ncbi:aldehyde dehydrogenase family protein [Roseomonas eburnea]|uniref:Aldehyde dehydrogenase family protein n=2 Tax=Neoroseomonas eburnea TaxID=1346889 RepID=A0A9X9XGV0_9PROT|nr:aldehyde dehydrogenase family protein [Neoroseomonas eburnea]
MACTGSASTRPTAAAAAIRCGATGCGSRASQAARASSSAMRRSGAGARSGWSIAFISCGAAGLTRALPSLAACTAVEDPSLRYAPLNIEIDNGDHPAGVRAGRRGNAHGDLSDIPALHRRRMAQPARRAGAESLGPPALISRTRSLDEAITKANALPFGLAGYAFTHSAPRVEQLSDQLEVGNLSINHLVASVAETPFGGVKDSGYGREGGSEGLACYTVTKNVSHRVAGIA